MKVIPIGFCNYVRTKQAVMLVIVVQINQNCAKTNSNSQAIQLTWKELDLKVFFEKESIFR